MRRRRRASGCSVRSRRSRTTPTCPARGRPDDDGRARAGAACSQTRAAALDSRLRRARQPRLPCRSRRGAARDARGGGRARARPRRRDVRRSPASSSASSARRASSAASPARALPDFGEPLLRQVYAETTREAEAIAQGPAGDRPLRPRVVLLHYAPVEATLEGEPEGIHVMLGSDRLATPIAEYGADLVLHGHAHAGSFEGCDRQDPGLQRRGARHRARLLDLRPRRRARPQRGDVEACLAAATLAAWTPASSASRSPPSSRSGSSTPTRSSSGRAASSATAASGSSTRTAGSSTTSAAGRWCGSGRSGTRTRSALALTFPTATRVEGVVELGEPVDAMIYGHPRRRAASSGRGRTRSPSSSASR